MLPAAHGLPISASISRTRLGQVCLSFGGLLFFFCSRGSSSGGDSLWPRIVDLKLRIDFMLLDWLVLVRCSRRNVILRQVWRV